MEKKEKLKKVEIHPFSICREKQPLGNFLKVTNKNNFYEEIEKVKEQLISDANELFKDISENLIHRDNEKKKLLKSLKTLRLDYPFKDYVSGNERIQGKLIEFQKKVDSLNEKLHCFQESFNKDYANNRDELRKLFKDNKEIYESLYVVNPEIYPKLDSYINDFETDNNKLRKLELVLMRIATKATTKTSPIGRMNRVSIIGNGEERKYEIDTNQISVNNVFLFRIFEAFLLSEDIIRQTKFTINKNYYFVDKDLYIITQVSENRKVFNTKDRSVKIAMNQYLQRFLMEKDLSEVSVETLRKIFPVKDETIEKLLKNFYGIGLIKFKEYFSDVYDSIGSLLWSIGEYEIPSDSKWNQVIFHLEEIKKDIQELNINYRNDIRQKILNRFYKISELAGIDRFKENEYLYEDYLVKKEGFLTHEEKLSEDLCRLLGLYPLFDINTRIQLDTLEEIKKAYKDTKVKVSDDHIFQIIANTNINYSSYWYDPWGEIESVSEVGKLLDKMKQEWKNYLINQFEKIKYEKGKKIVEIEDEFISSLRSRIPKALRENDVSYSLFYQMQDEKMIINKIYPGYMSFYNRFLRYTNIVEKYKPFLQDFYSSEKYDMAEVYETFGFNANVYNPVFNTRITSDLTRDESMNNAFKTVRRFEEMTIKEEEGKLFLEDDLGKLYKPVISTSLIRVLYPGFIAFYTSLFSNISHISELASIFFKDLKEEKIFECPRIVIGDIVLERQKFLFSTSMLQHIEQLDNIEAFLALREFFKNNGIPLKFFFQTRKKPYEDNSIRSLSVEFDKPQYFDLENILLLKVFLNALRTSKTIMISEILPENIENCEYLTEFNLKK